VSFFIEWPDRVLDTLYWSEDIKTGDGMWAAPGTLFKKDGTPGVALRIRHFGTRDEAEAVAFNMTVEDQNFFGQIVVVECDLSSCHCRSVAA
jgi:hypothetical protein